MRMGRTGIEATLWRLTFELSRPRRQSALALDGIMIRLAREGPVRFAGVGRLERRVRRQAFHEMASTRWRRPAWGSNGSGQYSMSRVIFPPSTVKNETGSPNWTPSVTLTWVTTLDP